MNWVHTFLILAVAFLAVFWEAAFGGIRALFGAQVHLLPALMVYTSLKSNLPTTVLLALVGGLGFDSLSANPLGVSMVPLFLAGLVVHVNRELLLQESPFAQSVLGAAVTGAVSLLELLLLLTAGARPLLGWGTLWQLAFVTFGGALASPGFFVLFDWLRRSFMHARAVESSFRPDREIRRGRA